MTSFFHKGLPKVKSDINSVDVHPQLSDDSHPLDGALVGAGSLRPTAASYIVCKAKFEPCSLQAHKFLLHYIAHFAKVFSPRGNPHYSHNLCHSISLHRAAMLEVSGLTLFQE